MAYDDFDDRDDRDDGWDWADQLEAEVERLINGEISLEVFAAWYREATQPQQATEEIKRAAKRALIEWQKESFRANLFKALNDPPPAERKLVFINGKFVGQIEMPGQRKPLYEMSGTIHYGGPAGGSMKD